MPSPDAHELDVPRVSAAYRRCVAAVCPEHLALASRLLERLEPGRWTLEWYLPWWLGQAWGVDPAGAEEVVLGNVLGLASIRLQDDLADGDIGPDDAAAAHQLSAALYERAITTYRRRFPESSPLWRHLDACMAAWRATAGGAGRPGHSTGLETRSLAARGAPLRISAFAMCLLAGRIEDYGALEACLDHALAGLVLEDHIGDWRRDLEAGRWNAFVATISDDPQESRFSDRNRSRVLLAMLTENAVANYYERITMEMTSAATLSETQRLASLAVYLREYAARTELQGFELQAHYRDAAERAGTLLRG